MCVMEPRVGLDVEILTHIRNDCGSFPATSKGQAGKRDTNWQTSCLLCARRRIFLEDLKCVVTDGWVDSIHHNKLS